MASISSTSTHLIEPWRVSRCSMRENYRKGSASTSISSKPSRSKGSQKRSARLSLPPQELSQKDSITENVTFEEGMFERNPFSESAIEDINENPNAFERKQERTLISQVVEAEGTESLVPERWKHLQQDIRMTKREKKTQLLMEQRENAQLNELRAELRRQRIDLLSEADETAHAQSLAGRTQLLTPSRLVELERDLSSKAPDPRFSDKEFDEMFTFDEKGFLKRTVPDFSQAHCRKWPILHMLAASGQYFFLEQFLNLGIEVEEEDEDGYTPLQRAVQARRETAVTQLLRAGANVNVHDKDGANLLHLSAQVNSMGLVRLFVIQGVQVNHADKYGWTPLHVAVMTGRDDIVRHLLLSGGDQSLRNQDGVTPMDMAIALGKGLNSNGLARTLRKLSNVNLRA